MASEGILSIHQCVSQNCAYVCTGACVQEGVVSVFVSSESPLGTQVDIAAA